MAQDQYDCTFKLCSNNSLQILIKDRKSKRKFSNIFTKTKLESLNLTYSINEIFTILQTAKDAKKNNLKNWKFLIKYTNNPSVDEIKLNPTNTLFSYHPGDQMVVLLSITEPRFYMKTAFKLREIQNIKNKPLPLPQSQTSPNNVFLFPHHSNPQQHNIHNNNNLPLPSSVPSKSKKNSLTIKKHTAPRRNSHRINTKVKMKSPRIIRVSQSPTTRHVSDSADSLRTRLSSIVAPPSYPSSATSGRQITITTSPRSSLQIAPPRQSLKEFKKKSIKRKFNAEDVLCLLEQEDDKNRRVERLQQQIKMLEADNDALLSKIKNISTSKTGKNANQNGIAHIKQTDKYWLKQKLEKVDTELLKLAGHEGDWKETMNTSFSIIQKLAKQLHAKEEQYELISSKWMMAKKENKELKKSKNELELQLKDRDTKIILLKDNQRNLSEKIRKIEREKKDSQLRLNMKYDTKIQEFSQMKREYDNMMKQYGPLQDENDRLLMDVQKLRYCVNETNRKSIQLIESINRSKQVINNLNYTLPDPPADSPPISDTDTGISLTLTYSKGGGDNGVI